MSALDEAISKARNRAYDFAIETFGQIIDVEVAKTKNETINAVLEITDDTIRAVSLSGIDRNLIMLGTLIELKDKFLALKGGDKE